MRLETLNYRPGLVYQHAFDWLAMRLYASGRSAACVAGLPFYQQELKRRLPGVPLLPPHMTALVPGSLTAVAWIEPSPLDLNHLYQIQDWLSSDGRLYLIVPGWLAAFTAERRRGLCTRPSGRERQVTRALANHHFRLVERIGWHGMTAVGWHLAGVAAQKLGRLDWQDRCHFGMRRHFAGRQPLVALTCLAAERTR